MTRTPRSPIGVLSCRVPVVAALGMAGCLASVSASVGCTLLVSQNNQRLLFDGGAPGDAGGDTDAGDIPDVSLRITADASVVAARCHPGTVALEGDGAEDGGELIVTLSSDATVELFVDQACQASGEVLRLVGSEGPAGFGFLPATPGVRRIMAEASAQRARGAVVEIDVTEPAPAGLDLSAPPVLLQSECRPVVVSLQNAVGQATLAAEEVAITVEGQALGVFADVACETAAADHSIRAGADQVVVYVAGDTLGPARLSVRAAGLDPASRDLEVARLEECPDLDGDRTVDGDDVASLIASFGPCAASCPADINGDGVVDSADLSLVTANSGPCPPASVEIALPPDAARYACNPMTLTLVDSDGFAVTAPGDVVLTVVSDGAGAFYLDEACTLESSLFVVQGGDSAVTAYYRDDVEQTANVAVDALDLPTSVLAVTLADPPPDLFALSGRPEIVQHECAAFRLEPIYVAGGFEVVSMAADTPVSVRLVGGTGAIFDDAACSVTLTDAVLGAGEDGLVLYVRAPVPAALSLVADVDFADGGRAVRDVAVVAPYGCADVTADGVVDATDVAQVAAAAGPCSPSGSGADAGLFDGGVPDAGPCAEDLNRDGTVDEADVSIAQGTLGPCPVADRLDWALPQAVIQDECTRVRVDVRGGTDAFVRSPVPVVVDVSAAGRFATDVFCTATTTQVTIPAGEASAAFFYQSSTAGEDDLLATAASGSLTAATATASVVALGVCPDFTGDLSVDVDDAAALGAAFGPCPAPPASCPFDLNGDGLVDTEDLSIVLGPAVAGPCP